VQDRHRGACGAHREALTFLNMILDSGAFNMLCLPGNRCEVYQVWEGFTSEKF
jgi:hypothetical protein